MKKIEISEDAYHRLLACKNQGNVSFSVVIKNMIPTHGSFKTILKTVQRLPTPDATTLEVFESTINKSNGWSNDSRY